MTDWVERVCRVYRRLFHDASLSTGLPDSGCTAAPLLLVRVAKLRGDLVESLRLLLELGRQRRSEVFCFERIKVDA